MALKLATEFLMPGGIPAPNSTIKSCVGTFVTKVFRSKDYNKLMWVFNQLFTKVEATKPPASRYPPQTTPLTTRNVSAEIFVVCRGFKAPQKLDPKFLDPRSVFEELPDPTPNAEAKVFHPEKRKRQREGYEDGDYTFYKEVSAASFVESQDPIQLLSSTSRITWTDETSRKLRFKELTTKDIGASSEDLKVLGKKEFRSLLKWRLSMREDLGLSSKKEEPSTEVAKETVTITEDDQIDAEMARLAAQDTATKKKERRKLNERKQREISRMQMGMLTPHELGMEQDAMDSDEIFGLKRAEQKGAMQGLLSGAVPENSSEEEDDENLEGSDDDEDADELEAQLDTM
jgi:AdoMet-dependent rRNA methyltransferase SPB1